MTLRGVTRSEAEAWIAAAGLHSGPGRFDNTMFQPRIVFPIPDEVWAHQHLAWLVAELTCTPGEGLFWTTEYGV